MSVKNRIKEFSKYSKIPVSTFEKSILVTNGYVNSISKSIGIDKIELILEKYPKLNIEWLLAGKGSMLKESTKDSALEQESYTGGNDELLKEKIAFQSEQIEFYKSKIEFLTAKLNTRKIPEGKELEEGMRIIDKIEEALSKKYI